MNVGLNQTASILNNILAKLIGVNGTIVLQQIHNLLEINKDKNNNFIENCHWICSTYEDLRNNCFDYWSTRTIKRIIKDLEKRGILISDIFNKEPHNRTKWYRVNYDKLDSIINVENTHSDNNCSYVETIENTHSDNNCSYVESIEETHSDNNCSYVESVENTHSDNNCSYVESIENTHSDNVSSKSTLRSLITQIVNDVLLSVTGQNKNLENKELELLKREKELKEKEIQILKQQLNESKSNYTPAPAVEDNKITEAEKYEVYQELIKENINYKYIKMMYGDNQEVMDLSNTFIDIMAEVMVSTKKTIKINKEDVGKSLVCKKFDLLTNSQFMFAMNQYREYAIRTEVKFPKQYIITCLYNATTEAVPKDYTLTYA